MSNSKISITALQWMYILTPIIFGIFLSYSSLPQWSIYIIILLMFIMVCILLWMSPCPEQIKKIRDKRRRNNLAKEFFHEFKDKYFVKKFKKIQSVSTDQTYSEYTFHDIFDRLKRDHQEFESLPNPDINSIRNQFNLWLHWYNYFNKKIDFESLLILLEEFGFIVRRYHKICISEPTKNISRINEENKIEINEGRKKDWETAKGYYDDFEKRYNDFIDEVNINREIGDIELSGLPPAKNL
jgi:hypothetical protein